MKLLIYIICCALVSLFYYLRVKKISHIKIALILLAIFAVDSVIKTVKTYIIHYDSLVVYFSDETMAISVIAMVFISWLAIEPLFNDIKNANKAPNLEEATDE
ncbi:hypothetical protein [Vibrio crassostreae]|uniref:hypothetical protein n=1 Tax=Vibrio crassostreae TaxID=246167 RepID=UPI000F504C47|nr:hypothetical protein [Vibrio crassostreae]RPF56183.1 hypothetical protein EDB61_10722 [Vibrio crassostreae]